MYELARAGREVEIPPRRVTIYSLELVVRQGDELTLDIRCSKGTYVRSLAHDLGEALGCGGHVARLRRLASAGFEIEQAVTLDALHALETPAQRALPRFPGDTRTLRFCLLSPRTDSAAPPQIGSQIGGGGGGGSLSGGQSPPSR